MRKLTAPAQLLQQCCPGRSNRRRHAASISILRDGGGVHHAGVRRLCGMQRNVDSWQMAAYAN